MPSETIIQPLLEHGKEYNYAIRLCSLTPEKTSIQYETEIRVEMTEINPIGLIVYSQNPRDYEQNLDDWMKIKTNRLYENANFTRFVDDHPNLQHSRYENENAEIEDLHGYENYEKERTEARSNTLESKILL